MVFIETANFSLCFHLASTRKWLKTIAFENCLQREQYENDTKTMCKMQYNCCVLIKNDVIRVNRAWKSSLQVPQNLFRNIFLIREICSQIKKILEYFSQNKKKWTHWETFSCPFCKKIWFEIRTYLKTRLIFFILRELFLASKYFLFQENWSSFETVSLNEDKLLVEGTRKFFLAR